MSFASRFKAAVTAARSAYFAGQMPVDRKPWIPQPGSARRTTAQARQLIVDRARDAVRNNPYAARIVDVWVANAIGAGITTRWKQGSPQEAAWRRWSASLSCDAERQQDWAGIQGLVMRGMVESGEALVRLQHVRATPENPVGLRLLVLEGDLLDTSRFGAAGDNRIVQGIEIDPAGAPAAYWLRQDYEDWPGLGSSQKTERVPADEIIHLYRRRRPGQVRDVSWLAPVLWLLKDLGSYEDALLRKAQIEACLSILVNEESEDTLAGEKGLFRDARGQIVEEVEPGMIMYRRGGGTIESVTPSGGGSHASFAKRTLEAAGVGAGLTYDQVSGDLTGANYSSLKAGKIEFRRLLEQVQYTILIPRLIERVADRFQYLGEVRGLWSGDVERSHVPPSPEMIDPLKDTMALIAQIRAGLVPPQDGPGQFGYDYNDVMRQYAAANALADDLGIALDTDVRRVAKSGTAQDAKQLAAIEIAATGAALPQVSDPQADADQA